MYATASAVRQWRIRIAVLAATALIVAACGTDAPEDEADGSTPPAAGMCAEDTPDCVDVVIEDPVEGAPDEAADVAAAEELLGTPEEALDADVRIARRGEEQFALTEDYVIGRQTVELDEIDGQFVVTSVTVELTDGPVTVTDAEQN
ncbi:MAG: hypothetical protein WD377_08540 [Nitriliruptoraceae bacterium]